jgi:ThiF family protein
MEPSAPRASACAESPRPPREARASGPHPEPSPHPEPFSAATTTPSEVLQVSDVEVTVVGAGRAGSQIALVLAMLGLRLRLYDGDRLGAENQGLQLYRKRDVVAGRKKVTALRGLLQAIVPGSRVCVHPVRFTAGPRQPRSPLVVLAVDTMAARRLLWEQLRGDAGLLLLLDLRLGRGLLRLHEVRPGDPEDVAAYEASLCDDSAAAPGDCSDEAATHAAAAGAALVGGAVRAFVEGLPHPRWIGLDLDRALWASGPRS